MWVKLASEEYGEGPPLLILHGLFGAARNWGSIARRLGRHHRVFTLDLRNHGRSPWTADMDYPAMARDVAAFVREHDLGTVQVLGHSMGGKAAMMLALTEPALVERLVVVDIAPVPYDHEHDHLIEAMESLDLSALTRRSEADERLRGPIPDDGVRLFLMQNLVAEAQGFRWRVNLRVIHESMPHILDFPQAHGARSYGGPTLFVNGGRSDYVQSGDEAAIRRLFPAARLHTIPEAAHWVHVDAPSAFLEQVQGFLGH